MKAGNGQPTCHICTKEYCSKRSLKRHLATHSNVSLPCTLCPKTFKTTASLRAHIRNHGKSHLCAECAAQFTSASNLARHRQQKHTAPYKHKCPVCFQCLSSALRLKEHVQHHQDLNNKDYDRSSLECNKCAKSFPSKCSYIRHLKVVKDVVILKGEK